MLIPFRQHQWPSGYQRSSRLATAILLANNEDLMKMVTAFWAPKIVLDG